MNKEERQRLEEVVSQLSKALAELEGYSLDELSEELEELATTNRDKHPNAPHEDEQEFADRMDEAANTLRDAINIDGIESAISIIEEYL